MDYIDSNVALIGLLLRFTARDLRNSDRQFSHFTNCQRKTTQSLGYLPRTEIQKYCQNLLISNLVTLEQYPAFPLGLSFTQTATKSTSIRALGTRTVVEQEKTWITRMCWKLRIFALLFQSVLSTSALLKSMLPSKQTYSTPNSLLKSNYPIVFRRFLLHFSRDLTPGNRAEFKFWCKGQIPGSKLDINPKNDEDFLGLIEYLLEFNAVSLTNLSLLKEFLITVGHHDLLQSLKQVELQISLSGILEGYIKSVIHLRHGTPVKLARDQASVSKFFLAIKEINKELISPVLNRQLEQVEDDSVVLQVIKSPLLKTSSLSWSKFTSYLVSIGEFYASFSWPRNQLPDVVADGHFTSLFSDTKTCELLTEWMLKNGGLVSDWNKYATYVKWRFTAKIISLCSDLSKFYCEVDRTGKFVS